MTNINNIIVGVLSGLLIIGIIILQAMDKEVLNLISVLTLLIGYFVGMKQHEIVGAAKKILRKK